MFKKTTVLIIGAGASAEFNMPIGSGLMKQIAEAIQFDVPNIHDPQLRKRMEVCFGYQRTTKLAELGKRLSCLIPRFNSMDEILHFLSDDVDIVEFGKIAIAHLILKAETNSFLNSALNANLEAITRCDSTWANRFLGVAVNGARRQDFAQIFSNVSIVDFNYDRVLPAYLHSALQRLYGFTHDEATASIKGLKILHPYGFLGPLEWQSENGQLKFGSPEVDLKIVANQIRTFTEERSAGEFNEIKEVIKQGRTLLVLGFGFHVQNIEIISLSPGSDLPRTTFMTVMGVGTHNHDAIAIKMQNTFRTDLKSQMLAEEATSLVHQLQTAISLAVS
jgi:hypothetical protein